MFLSIVLLLVLMIPSGGNSSLTPGETGPLPVEYGEVLFQHNEKSPKQLYIVGISHGDTLTGSNGLHTSQVEAEIYRIGEWLIRNKNVELLLPEGFFSESPACIEDGSPPKPVPPKGQPAKSKSVSNPESLLRANFAVVMRQVEDKDLYQTVYRRVQRLAGCRDDSERYRTLCDLDYDQKRRVGIMLQKIPGIIDKEFAQARIHGKKAIFTIGLSHVSSIIRYLSEEKIIVPSPLFTSVKHEGYSEKLKLLKEDFGVTVILPRTLADDRKVLRMNGLEHP